MEAQVRSPLNARKVLLGHWRDGFTWTDNQFYHIWRLRWFLLAPHNQLAPLAMSEDDDHSVMIEAYHASGVVSITIE